MNEIKRKLNNENVYGAQNFYEKHEKYVYNKTIQILKNDLI